MNRKGERGQILPIAAVAIVVLIGIAGLVMDVGFTWMLLRREQAAVDVATVAAARHIPDGNVAAMEQAACFYARANGFFGGATTYDLSGTGCVPANDVYNTELTVNFPPGPGPYENKAGYVEVILNGSHRTYFSGVFGINSMAAAANAVSANIETTSSSGQLVALDPTSCGAGRIRGNAPVIVEGGVYVNSNGTTANPYSSPTLAACPGTAAQLDDDVCSGASGAFMFNGSNARLDTPLVSVRGICGQNANPYPASCTIHPCGLTERVNDIADTFDLPTPTIAWAGEPGQALKTGGVNYNRMTECDASQANNQNAACTFGAGGGDNCGTYCELFPGVYYGGWNVQTTVCLNPGFYYFAGGGISVSGAAGRLVTLDTAAGDTCAAAAANSAVGGDGRVLLYFADGPNCPATGTIAAGDRRCMGSDSGVFGMTGQSGFAARGYEITGGTISGSDTDEDYHRLLMWVDEFRSDGLTPTRRVLPADTDISNDKVSISGQGRLDYWGTIYAPKSLVEILGVGTGAGDVAGVQILAWQFDLGGNGTLNMPFDPNELSSIIAKGLVH